MESSRHLSGSYKVSVTDQSLALNKFSNRRLKYLIWPYDLFPGFWENISPASPHHCAAVSLGITLPAEGPGSFSGLPRPRTARGGAPAAQPCGPSGRVGGCLDLSHQVDGGRVTEEVGAFQSSQTCPAGPRADPMPAVATRLLLFISSPLGGPLAASSSSVSSGVVLRPSCPVESPRESADPSPLPVRPGSLGGGPGGSGSRSSAGTPPVPSPELLASAFLCALLLQQLGPQPCQPRQPQPFPCGSWGRPRGLFGPTAQRGAGAPYGVSIGRCRRRVGPRITRICR